VSLKDAGTNSIINSVINSVNSGQESRDKTFDINGTRDFIYVMIVIGNSLFPGMLRVRISFLLPYMV